MLFSENSCLTIEGAPLLGRVGQVGVQCKFPFSFAYLGMTFGPYDACADYFGTLYCATEVDSNGNALNFGVCDPNCALSGKETNVFIQKYFDLFHSFCPTVTTEALLFQKQHPQLQEVRPQ